jgi:hypothetical protein
MTKGLSIQRTGAVIDFLNDCDAEINSAEPEAILDSEFEGWPLLLETNH